MSAADELGLTTRAERALSAYLALQRESIIERARSAASTRAMRTGAAAQVDASDIISAIPSSATAGTDDAQEFRQSLSIRTRSQARLLTLISIYSWTLIIGGVLFALFFQFREKLNYSTILALAVGAAGAALAVASFALQRNLRTREGVLTEMRAIYGIGAREATDRTPYRDSTSLRAEYVARWSDLERTVLLAAADKSRANDITDTSLRGLVEILTASGDLDDDDVDTFFAGLRMRNSILHGIGDTVSDEELEDMIRKIQRLNRRLTRNF